MNRPYPKLSFKFYGPERVGVAAYRLEYDSPSLSCFPVKAVYT
uniref:Uncharacterized protein n=1 Tax=Arundo donax TaxID=35708 RepID=A0A0A8YAK9_ARUDO